MASKVTYELDGHVATITLNRPDSLNAFSQEMLTALVEQLAGAEANPDVRCVVLTGAGRGFCSGGDVKGMAARDGATDMPIDQAIRRPS